MSTMKEIERNAVKKGLCNMNNNILWSVGLLGAASLHGLGDDAAGCDKDKVASRELLLELTSQLGLDSEKKENDE